MTPNESTLSKCHINPNDSYVSIIDETILKIKSFWTLPKHQTFFVPNIRLVPKLNLNLLFVSQIMDHGCKILFLFNDCLIQDLQSRKPIGRDHKRDLYVIKNLELSKHTFCNFVKKKDIENWHKRLRHTSVSKLPFLINYKENNFVCKDCILSKMKSLPFGPNHFISKKSFELVHLE
jgi:hypothetical protein